MQAAFSGLATSFRVFPIAFANPDLRRTSLAFAGFGIAELATWVAIIVFAYEAGGVAAAGLVSVVQLIPAAIFAPFVSVLGDRFPRHHALMFGYASQGAAMAVTAVSLLIAVPVPAVFALAAVTTTIITLTRPLHGALLPALAREPEELTAAYVASSAIESLSVFIGPAVAGLLLTVANPGTVFMGMAGVLVWSALLMSRVSIPVALASSDPPDEAPGVMDDLLGGFRALGSFRRAQPVVALIGAQAVVVGALDVLFVVLAFQVLGTGGAGSGFLTSALGAGGIVGAGLTVLLVGRRRLVPPLLAGALIWAIGLGATGFVSNRVTVPVFIAAAGVGGPLIDVSGRTLLQRTVPDRVLSRVLGVLEGLSMAGLAVGAAAAPGLVAFFGERASVIAVGVVLPLVALAGWRRLNEIDASTVIDTALLTLLRSVPIFAPLSAPILERLARQMIPVEVPAGAVIIQQDDVGDRFYILVSGEVDVTMDGRHVDAHGPGGYFGEVALIRAVPRTATVTALSDVTLYALEREDFLEAVTGQPESAAAADAISEERVRRATEAAADPPAG
jgi:MFS family permease